MQSNPALDPWTSNPYGAPPFDSITPQHILPALRKCIEEATAAISEICSNVDEPTFANTAIPYETDSRLEKLRQVRSFFISIVNTVEAFVSEKAPGHQLLQDFDQHDCQSVILGRFCKVPTQDLAAEDARLVHFLIEGFISRGTASKDDPSSQNEAASLLKGELTSLRSAYTQTIKDHMAVPTEFELHNPSNVDAELLAAYAVPAPETPADAPVTDEDQKAKSGNVCRYRVPNYPDVVDRLLSHCSVRSVRETLWTNFRNRGKPANYSVARSILITRSKISSIMRFPNHALFKMRHSMVSDPGEILRLYKSLLEPAKRAFQSELSQLLASSACDGISEPRDFMQWDYKYYSEKMRKGDTSLVSFEEMPMFKLSEVMGGISWLVQELYGVTMSPAHDAPVYHSDARPYCLTGSSHSLLGLLYVDVWARAGKAPGNWTQQVTRPSSFSAARPVVSLNCNFKRLFSDREGMNFDHVKLVLHEFGHSLHCLLSDVKYASLSGMVTPDDHVELPSTLHEKFLHDPRFLSRITSSALPAGICSKLMANDCKSIGYTVLRSVSSSILDLTLHTLPLHALESLDVEDFERKLYAELGMPPQIPYLYESSAFEHIFRFDYRYYMYMWSSFLVSSALSVFLNRGSCEIDVGVLEGPKGRQSAADCDQEHHVCDVSPSARMDLSSANVTPVAVMPSAGDMSVSAARSSLRELSAALSVEALSSQSSETHEVRGGVAAAADGLSLVHRAAGASFVRHVLSKGNSVDVWQGFLSFIGGHFDPTDFLRQRGLDVGAAGFRMDASAPR